MSVVIHVMIHDVYLKSHDMKYRSRDLEMVIAISGVILEKIIIFWRVLSAVAIGYEKIHHLQGGDGFMKCAEV